MPRLAAPLVMAVLALSAATARADMGPPSMREPGTYLSAGLTTAITFSDDTGGALGGEVSLVGLNQIHDSDGIWFGGYVDALYDFRTSGGRISAGPEIGWVFFGADAGYVASFTEAGYQHGFTVRALLTFAVVALYTRVGHLFAPSETWGEVGLLIKYPLSIAGPGPGIE